MICMGVDIGYGNLKVAFGAQPHEGETALPTTKLLPAGAGRFEDLPQRLTGGAADDGVIIVNVAGTRWVAGLDQARLEGSVRQLHSDYPATDAYRALFHAALLMGSADTVDHLVTGLPVSQALDKDRADRLRERLSGEHQVTERRTVRVKRVTVVPQPAGAFFDLVQGFAQPEMLSEARVMVIDPGFFSVDWVAIENGEIRRASSGTSTRAMSVVIEEVNRLIRVDHGGTPGVERLEQAIRANAPKVPVFGQAVDLPPYLAQAAAKVADDALTEMKQTLRQNDRSVDFVLIAGGGASAYKEAAVGMFPRSQILVPDEPVLANARGFWHYACAPAV